MLTSEKIIQGLNGVVEIPGDKSISHRSIIIPSITNGISEVKNILKLGGVQAIAALALGTKTVEKVFKVKFVIMHNVIKSGYLNEAESQSLVE